MRITEPITMLTDYAIAIETLIFAVMLWRSEAQKQVSVRCWAVALAAVGVAAFLGGTCHGFVVHLGRAWLITLWQLMFYLLSLASFLMLSATVVSTLPRRSQRWFILVAGTKSMLYLVWAANNRHFGYAIADYLSAMVIVLFLQLWALYRQCTPKSARWIIAGILLSGVAVTVQASPLAIGSFTSTDVYHLIQMVALYLFYRGACLLTDRVPGY
ncbi:MAG: hypothetical protein Kow00121_07680 [Elainellaceae cyanobacterium]